MMIAHCHGQLWNAVKIASSLGINAGTVKNYLDLLTDLYLLRQLQPLFPNIKKRLVKSPKVYVRDSGLLHCMLGIKDREDLFGYPNAGASWEGWAIEQVLSLAPANGIELSTVPTPERKSTSCSTPAAENRVWQSR